MTQEILSKVTAINSAIGRVSGLYVKWAQKHNINLYTLKTLYVLNILNAGTFVTQRQISEELTIPKQSINNIIVSLEKEGFVSLTPSLSDKREKNIMLTEKGNQYASEILAPLVDIETKVAERMREQAEQLIEAATSFGDFFELEMLKEDKARKV